jgi:hypothetical protein
MLRGNFFRGLGYLGEGFRLIRQPGLRLFVVIPLVINILLFGLLFYFLGELFGVLIATAMGWLPDWAWLQPAAARLDLDWKAVLDPLWSCDPADVGVRLRDHRQSDWVPVLWLSGGAH